MTEEFGSTIDEVAPKKQNVTKYRKTEYINLWEGEHKVRILESMETKKYTHYVGWSYLECLGDECPICENNKKILYEHHEDYAKVKGWCPKRPRYYINVLDKTPTKVCPKDGKENQPNAVACTACGTLLEEA